MFAAILRSRTSRQEVVGELAKKYGADVGSKLVNVEVSLRDKGVVALIVESTDRALAAETANLYFQVLDRVIERLAEQATRRQETFYADQLQRAAREVATAEEAVLKFQAENRVVQVDAPARGAVDASAGLRGQIMALELQREVGRMRMTDQHPQMREMDKQIAELKKQYSKNLFGAPMELPGETPGQRRKEFFVSTEKMTPMQFAFLKLYRNLKIQEAFYTGALQGLEQLKYNDGAHNVRVEPLDPAVPPEVHTRPRILLTLFAAVVGGLIVSILVVYVIEYIRRLLAEERATRSRAARLDRRADALGPLTPPDDSLMQPDPFSVAGRSRQ
jgi:tyrosine-protein kinase Etk/Wzc